MSKGKLAKFADMASYPHVFEYPYSAVDNVPFEMKGKWNESFFGNDRPIVLELGCGRGEYTVGLGRLFPDKNFIGVDIKGSRMWSGATESLQAGMKNVAFLRTNIEIIDRFFSENEVSEIWLTFSDPQMKKATKRLTSTYFMERYRKFLKPISCDIRSCPGGTSARFQGYVRISCQRQVTQLIQIWVANWGCVIRTHSHACGW